MSATHTYLDLVNAVLTRLREDTVASVAGDDDVVVNLVKEFVNDAKRTVEDSHPWSALSTEWTATTSITADTVVLEGSSRSPILEVVLDSDGNQLMPMTKSELRKRALQAGSKKANPRYYILDGKESDGDIRLRMWPAPDTVQTLHVYGYQRDPELALDADVLKVPAVPVIYLAQAMAARERGEVAGQTSGELFGLAKSYPSNAISQDSTNSDLENIWTTV